ncbi:MAG: enoyl-CoA hydratase/isomerase family protein [Acidimicrobiia bacterium]|jgi:enoyl-CoA hydratase/carnithine racemase|nr:enoyl-CoA hydratase/isomerase family protein [Acidimicrobiia bacterium]MDQ3390375.1 enoyl-CoA hydratase/isomerase family protein [Actinomycetota bacterium]
MTELRDYQHAFKTAVLERDELGVLTIRLHSKGDTLWWGALPHRELADLFAAVAADRDNRVGVVTGTGDRFVTMPDGDAARRLAVGGASAMDWDAIIREGHRLVTNMLEIEVPMIAAVNGPVIVHSELAVLCDIVLCTPDSYFQDAAHFPAGLVPGDGMQVIWPLLLGPNRGRYFLLTGEALGADEALARGVVGEIVASEALIGRAVELAHQLANAHPVALRNTRHALVRPLRRAIADDLHTGLALEALASLAGRDAALTEAGQQPDRP